MITKNIFKGFAIIATSAIFSMSTIQSAYAKPGLLVNSPLFLSAVVDPNVFFTLDDSGSMDWGPMQQDTTEGGTTLLPVSGGLPTIDGRTRAYYTPTFTNLYRLYHCYFVLPPFTNGAIPEWDKSWVVRTHVGNRNYYNPNVKYAPWPGIDGNGDRLYEDAEVDGALEHPDNPGGEDVDLETTYTYTEPDDPGNNNCDNPPNPNATAPLYIPTYYTWDDNNGDGVIDARDIGDGDDLLETDDLTTAEILAAERKITDPDELENFANWFQYHRSRMNSTKYIIGSTINNTQTTRMGIRWFNDGHAKDLLPMSNDPANGIDGDANKLDLLNELYEFVTQRRGTPARTALEKTGRYFDRDDNNADDPNAEPILPFDEGGECQQNFNILMSDGFWNSSTNPSVGNADRNVSTGPTGQEQGINPNDPPPITAKYFDGDASESVDGGNYEDGSSNTLADVAMHYYEHDLADSIDNKVRPQEGIDLATHQHMVTYTIAFGLDGTLDTTMDPAAPGFPGWPVPVRNTNTTVDDMWHAAYNGRGLYLSAQDPQQLADSLDAALSDIAKRTATAAAVSINSAKLTTESIVYLANFNTNGWQGDLRAFKIKTDAQGNLDPTGELEALPVWSAADELNSRTSARNMMTYNGTDGVELAWGNLTLAQQADLRTNPSGGTDDVATGQARLDYVKSNELVNNNATYSGYNFRQRQSLLADLVNSGPVYVGQPALNWPDKAPFPTDVGERYSDFKNGPAKDRTPVVYAGSNGGFMHGFDASSDDTAYGQEKMAYAANFLFSSNTNEGLHYLSDPTYAHRYYNDLTPSVSDVYDGNDWQTVLVSGVRGGGRGIFALDVTDPDLLDDPASNAANVVMWEFTNADDPDMGFSYSRPQIGLSNEPNTWVAIFGNGYNATGDGRAKLFIVKIHKSAGGNWIYGTDYKTIDAWTVAADGNNNPADDVDGDGDNDDRNGLGTPALADIDGNGTIDRAYAGDLNGKMWAFDLSGDFASWDLDYGRPLFTTNGNEAITAQPTLSRHPTVSTDGTNDPNLMVFFGSGQFLVEGDKITNNTQHFYGVWDNGAEAGGLDETRLQRQTYENGYVDVFGNPVRVLTRTPVDYLTPAPSGKRGWFFDLPDSRERSITRPVVRGDVVFFNTYVPDTDPCEPQGYGYRMAVDIINGGSPDDVTFDVNNDGVINDDDRARNGGLTSTVVGLQQEGFLPEPVFIEDIAYTADTPSKVAKLKKIPKGRFSWQELIQ